MKPNVLLTIIKQLSVRVVVFISAGVAVSALAIGCASPEPQIVVNTVVVDRVVTVEVLVPQTVVVRRYRLLRVRGGTRLLRLWRLNE